MTDQVTLPRAVVEQALASMDDRLSLMKWQSARNALRSALAKAEQAEKPKRNICIQCRNADSWGLPDKPVCRSCVANSEWQPLNTSSKNPMATKKAEQRQEAWQGLSDEEIDELWQNNDTDWESIKRVEAKLREKNGGAK